MKNWLMILQMIGPIIGIVKQVETAMPGQGLGAHKLNLVLGTVGTATAAVPEVATALQGHDMNGIVTTIANSAVRTMNAAGVFQK